MTIATDFVKALNDKFVGATPAEKYTLEDLPEYTKIVLHFDEDLGNATKAYGFFDKKTGDLYSPHNDAEPYIDDNYKYAGELLLTQGVEDADWYGCFLNPPMDPLRKAELEKDFAEFERELAESDN